MQATEFCKNESFGNSSPEYIIGDSQQFFLDSEPDAADKCELSKNYQEIASNSRTASNSKFKSRLFTCKSESIVREPCVQDSKQFTCKEELIQISEQQFLDENHALATKSLPHTEEDMLLACKDETKTYDSETKTYDSETIVCDGETIVGDCEIKAYDSETIVCDGETIIGDCEINAYDSETIVGDDEMTETSISDCETIVDDDETIVSLSESNADGGDTKTNISETGDEEGEHTETNTSSNATEHTPNQPNAPVQSKHGRHGCQLCPMTFSNCSNLAQHYRIHTGEKPFKCGMCGQVFRKSNILKRHGVRVHRVNNPFACDVCGRRFEHWKKLKYHSCKSKVPLATVKPEIDTSPDKSINRSFTQNSEFQENLKENFGGKEEDSGNFQGKGWDCDVPKLAVVAGGENIVCENEENALGGKVSPDDKYIIDDDRGENLFECEMIVGDEEVNVDEMDLNVESHISNKNACEGEDSDSEGEKRADGEIILGDIEANAGIVSDMHKTKKSKREWPFRCRFCPKIFHQSSSLLRHLLDHKNQLMAKNARRDKRWSCPKTTGEEAGDSNKRHKCDKCSMTFTSSSNLFQHYMIHTGERPYRCGLCDRTFRKSNVLKRHGIGVHNVYDPFACDVCGRRFEHWNKLKDHTRVCKTSKVSHATVLVESASSLEKSTSHGFTRCYQKSEEEDIGEIEVNSRGISSEVIDCDKEGSSLDSVIDNKENSTDSELIIGDSRPNVLDIVDFSGNPFECDVIERYSEDNSHKKESNFVEHQEKAIIPVCKRENSEDEEIISSELIADGKEAKEKNCEANSDANISFSKIIIRQRQWSFRCQFCPKLFHQSSSLLRHSLEHENHMQTNGFGNEFRQCPKQTRKKVDSLNRTHKCNLCFMTFTSSNNLFQHYMIHTGEKPYKCGLCDRTFRKSSVLKRHGINVHKVKDPFACDVCGLRFEHWNKLKLHSSCCDRKAIT